jgi:hypothetical protein
MTLLAGSGDVLLVALMESEQVHTPNVQRHFTAGRRSDSGVMQATIVVFREEAALPLARLRGF